MTITKEMVEAGAKAIFFAEIGKPDWNIGHWGEFKQECFRNSQLVLEAALATLILHKSST